MSILTRLAIFAWAQTWVITPGFAASKIEPSPAAIHTVPIANAVHYWTVKIDGLNIFYRESGPQDAPVILLLHGFPASSFMYRDLMAQLSDRFHLIAPDYPGFGSSEAPSPQAFAYTFDRLADIVAKFTDTLGLNRYALYMQDFGGPVGFRLASRIPRKCPF